MKNLHTVAVAWLTVTLNTNPPLGHAATIDEGADSRTVVLRERSDDPRFTKSKTSFVSLAVGTQIEFPVPLWEAGTVVTARFEPTNSTELSRPAVFPLSNTGSGIRNTPRGNEMLTKISFALRVGEKTLTPQRGAAQRKFAIKVNEPADAATAIVKNVGTQPLQGKLTVLSTDAAQKGKTDAARRAQDIILRTDQTHHADLLLAYNHILKRHLCGYPGGKSDVEQRVAHAIAKAGGRKETLVALSHASAAMQPHLETKAKHSDLISRPIHVSIKSADIKVFRDHYFTPSLRESGIAKYGIELLGIRSHRCADDVGAEIGCDIEEPYVVWSAFGPNYVRTGITEDGETAGNGSEYLYRTNTHVLSAAIQNMTPVDVGFPLTFVYQVIENDPDGPTKDQLSDALKTGIAVATELYGKDYVDGANDGIAFFKDVMDIATRAFGGGDDRYPSMGIVLDEDRISEYTSGTSPGPSDQSFFDHPGSYRNLGIRAPVVTVGGKKQWTLLYIITRTDKF